MADTSSQKSVSQKSASQKSAVTGATSEKRSASNKPEDESAKMIDKLQEMQDRRKQRSAALGRVATHLKRMTGLSRHQDKKWDTMLRAKLVHLFVFSMAGVLGTIVMSMVRWYWRPNAGDAENGNEIFLDDESTQANIAAILYITQFCITFSTVVSCGLIYQYYTMLVEEKRREWSGIDQFDIIASDHDPKLVGMFESSYSLWTSTMKYKCLIEVLIHLPHPIIWTNPDQNQNDFYKFCQVVVFCRLYLVLRLVYTFSAAYIMRFEVLSSSRTLQQKGFQIDQFVVTKLHFYNYPGSVTFALCALTILLSGFWMFVLERSRQPAPLLGYGSLQSCFWFAWVTWSTCGYGDIYPQTYTGRFVVVFIGLSNLAILSLFGAVVTNLLAQSREQKYVSQYLAMKEAREEYRNAGAELIQVCWRRQHAAKNKEYRFENSHIKTKHKGNAVYAAIKSFRRSRWNMKMSQASVDDPIIEKRIEHVVKGVQCLLEDLEDHTTHMKSVEQNIRERTRHLIRAVKEYRRQKNVT